MKFPIYQCPYSHFCIKAIRILRTNTNIEEPISLLLAFLLSFLNLNYLFLQAMPACMQSIHCTANMYAAFLKHGCWFISHTDIFKENPGHFF